MGHLEQMNRKSLTRRVQEKTIVGNGRRGRPKKTWMNMVKNDMKKRNLTLEDARDKEVEGLLQIGNPDALGCWLRLKKANGNEMNERKRYKRCS